MDGTMIWFNSVKDLGFISTEEGERLYVHGSGFKGGTRPERRCAGRQVTFEVIDDGGARRAEKVAFVSEVAPRRARRRQRSTWR
jgi:cold shock CspA family protein